MGTELPFALTWAQTGGWHPTRPTEAMQSLTLTSFGVGNQSDRIMRFDLVDQAESGADPIWAVRVQMVDPQAKDPDLVYCEWIIPIATKPNQHGAIPLGSSLEKPQKIHVNYSRVKANKRHWVFGFMLNQTLIDTYRST